VLEVLDRDSGGRRIVPTAGSGEELFGSRGIFLKNLNVGEVIFASYDGSEERRFSTDAVYPLAESPDGRLVALATAKERFPVRVEVWDVHGARKLGEWSEPGPFELVLSGPPYRVVCASRVEGKSGAVWISGDFRVHDADNGKIHHRLDLSGP